MSEINQNNMEQQGTPVSPETTMGYLMGFLLFQRVAIKTIIIFTLRLLGGAEKFMKSFVMSTTLIFLVHAHDNFGDIMNDKGMVVCGLYGLLLLLYLVLSVGFYINIKWAGVSITIENIMEQSKMIMERKELQTAAWNAECEKNIISHREFVLQQSKRRSPIYKHLYVYGRRFLQDRKNNILKHKTPEAPALVLIDAMFHQLSMLGLLCGLKMCIFETTPKLRLHSIFLMFAFLALVILNSLGFLPVPYEHGLKLKNEDDTDKNAFVVIPAEQVTDTLDTDIVNKDELKCLTVKEDIEVECVVRAEYEAVQDWDLRDDINQPVYEECPDLLLDTSSGSDMMLYKVVQRNKSS